MKNIVLLGASGSIGQSSVNVIRQNLDLFNLQAIAINQDLDKALEIVTEFNVGLVYIASDSFDISHPIFSSFAKVITQPQEFCAMVQDDQIHIVISAIAGFAGLNGSYLAIEAGKETLIANKESIVTAADILMPLAIKTGASIIPVDSEHNAISQCLQGSKRPEDIFNITITASGGPFRALTLQELEAVSIEDALKHPTWKMGPKITIDSATLMNKCLELIEASFLFDVPENKIDILVHPQSIIHSMVTFVDGSTIAQMSNPNMEVPIANALGLGTKLPISFDALKLQNSLLSFEPIPKGREAIFDIARSVCQQRGSLGAIFNAANEVAVQSFIEKRISFVDIYEVVERTFSHFSCSKIATIEEVHEHDKQARIQAEKVIKSLN